jgi:hypothetical protein
MASRDDVLADILTDSEDDGDCHDDENTRKLPEERKLGTRVVPLHG